MIKRILFLTYQNRSGSTLLLNLFSRDNAFLSCLEAEILIEELLMKCSLPLGNEEQEVKHKLINDKKLSHWEIPSKVINDLPEGSDRIQLFLSVLEEYSKYTAPSTEVACFKGTKLAECYSEVKRLFELKGIRCDLIRLVRDPRAVYCSQRTTVSPTTRKVMGVNPLDVARSWRDWVGKTDSIPSVYTVKFEDLVQNGPSYFLNLCSDLGIPFKVDNPEGTLYERLEQGHKMIHRNITKPLMTDRISAWQSELKQFDKQIIGLVCSTEMKEFGYDLPLLYKMGLRFTVQYSIIRLFSFVRHLKKRIRLV